MKIPKEAPKKTKSLGDVIVLRTIECYRFPLIKSEIWVFKKSTRNQNNKLSQAIGQIERREQTCVPTAIVHVKRSLFKLN